MSNRVEDLERQVAELQAAVNGLTEELVEMKERVRQVEDAQEVSVTAEQPTPASEEADDETAEAPDTERRTHSDDHVEVVERTGDGSTAGTGASAGDSGASEGEAAEAESADESDEAGTEESDSDIIVA
jgi:hypothetical protein